MIDIPQDLRDSIKDLRVGSMYTGKIHFRSGAGGATNSYITSNTVHMGRMRYTVSQIVQSQQVATALMDFAAGIETGGEYLALSVLDDNPVKIDPYQELSTRA